MSETKFTPGPWHIGQGKNTGARTIIADDETWVGFAYGTRLGVGTVEAAEANAKLIAAAPELLKELRMYVIACACGNHSDGVIKINSTCHRCRPAVAAIEKATT